MATRRFSIRRGIALLLGAILACSLAPRPSAGAGVTIITHGFSSDVSGWISGMADRIPGYSRFPGTNFTLYTIAVTYNAGSYYFTTTRTNGGPPAATDSGEIIVKLDWSQLAGGLSAPYDFSTYAVAFAVSQALMQTNLTSELGGHALVEFPLHLIGHSRGGSLMAELSRLLGTNGLWVDHLTTLDPHPLNNDGFFDPFLPTDASAHYTYANVLFADNYWQNLGDGLLDPDGEPVDGAYVRQLYDLSGGYNNTSTTSPDHSNVHLWYHGTLDGLTPASDTEASITSAERTNWWVTPEDYGAVAGFYYSLIGGGDRLGTNQPLGAGFAAIRDGYNQWWDLGAGQSSNRTALAANSGAWPNPIKFNRTDTNAVVQGQSTSVKLYYQWAQPNTNLATVSIYLDDDLNPFNANDRLLSQFALAGNGASSVSATTMSLTLDATNAPPGHHALYARIDGGGRTRCLYAPELVQVIASRQPPTLDIARGSPGLFQIGVNGVVGQTIVLQASSDLMTWQPLATNTLAADRWVYSDSQLVAGNERYYRALVQ